MDFPLFHLDMLGDRLLIAIVAIVHVIINHALAVGFIPIVVLMEYRGYKESKISLSEGKKWDELAYKLMFFAFIITTSVGAVTGVGIWFSAALVSPASIGSLIRVFFGAWFTEWIIFVLEVVFIMIYFLTWKKTKDNPVKKWNHIKAGGALTIFSWLTMAIIVGILGFMMDTGDWNTSKTFIDGFTNPIYIPQLFFRTPMAFVMAGSIVLFMTIVYTKNDLEFRGKVLKNIALWMFLWTPHVFAAGMYYYYKIPNLMVGNLPVAVGTQRFQNWYDTILYFLFACIIVSMLIAIWAALKPRRISKWAAFITIIITFLTIGTFERIREFIRKPYVISNYMYSNLFRVEDYDKYKVDGILKHAVYTSTPEITVANRFEAGENVFGLACSRCHTIGGVNSVVTKFQNLLTPNGGELPKDKIVQYIPVMHIGRYYMPPFPGNEEEINVLAEYIIAMQKNPQPYKGVEDNGVVVSTRQMK